MLTPPLKCSEYNFVLDNPKVRLGSSPSYSKTCAFPLKEGFRRKNY
jgi:hypothetical protein